MINYIIKFKYRLFPLVTLFDVDKIESKYKNYLMGTTNQLLLDSAINKQNFDLVINIDNEKIIPFFSKKVKNNKSKDQMEIKGNKDIYEITKNEKKILNTTILSG